MLKGGTFNPEAAQERATHVTTVRWSHEQELGSPGKING